MRRHYTFALLISALHATSLIVFSTARAESSAAIDPVIRALRQSEAPPPVLDQACELLRRAEESRRAPISERQRILIEIAGKLREKDIATLQARGDAARLGLYGLPKNLTQAAFFYTQAAEQQSGVGGYNASLLLYLKSQQKPNKATAQHILNLLQKSTITHYNANGIVAAQAHYLAAQIHERGLAGRKDPGKAFLHYRVSARNGYVPGVYRYLRLLSNVIAHLSEDERDLHIREMRTMTTRWKWSSPDIMRLTGDLHAAGLLEDDQGFHAQYHWRIAARMWQDAGVADTQNAAMSVSSDSIMEARVNKAVEFALKQNKTSPRTYKLEFANMCFAQD